MAQMLTCQIEDASEEGGSLEAMLNLDHVLWLRPQSGQAGKTQVRLVNGETLWLLGGLPSLGLAVQAAGDSIAILEAPVLAADPAGTAELALPK